MTHQILPFIAFLAIALGSTAILIAAVSFVSKITSSSSTEVRDLPEVMFSQGTVREREGWEEQDWLWWNQHIEWIRANKVKLMYLEDAARDGDLVAYRQYCKTIEEISRWRDCLVYHSMTTRTRTQADMALQAAREIEANFPSLDPPKAYCGGPISPNACLPRTQSNQPTENI
jgi:hypothetical protein